MAAHDVEIDFSLDETIVPGTPAFDFLRYMKFWERARPWLAERGITLFELYYGNAEYCSAGAVPVFPLDGVGGDVPYASHDDAAAFHDELADNPAFTAEVTGRVAFAQDKEHRHLALKLVRRDSDEERVFHRLLEVQRTHPYGYIRGVLPVFDLLSCGGHWLAVMPRWGESVWAPNLTNVREVLTVVRDLLAGLAALHVYRIAHRDISHANMLVNHFPVDKTLVYNNQSPLRVQLRKDGRIKYALFDFNHSAIYPLSAALSTCRLPRRVLWFDPNMPDLAQGEYEYNPFPYDVWDLGEHLRSLFYFAIPRAPILAPLIEGMTAWDASARFTAQHALELFEELYATLTAAELDAAVPPRSQCSYDRSDFWAGLAPEFVGRWCHLRRPPPPAWRRLLCWVCRCRVTGAVVRAVRRVLRL